MIDRLQAAAIAKSKKSILLLGPRQVGKSTLIKSLKPQLHIDFSNEQTLLDFAGNPSSLPDLLARKASKTVFIDEVQRLPSILNTVQSLIDQNKSLKFYLTGSSARKLKRGGANLLPGRVINYTMGPITGRELNYKFDMTRALQYGFLPEVLTLSDESEKKDILLSYGASYIREEIQAEALTKSIESFARFLNEACRHVGLFVDYTKIARNAKISRHTCPNFFEILEDTMIGFRIFCDPLLLDQFDLVKHPKFFLFDVGVLNALERSFDVSARRVGSLMEQLVFQQIFFSANVLKKSLEMYSFRTRGGLEVDFLIQLEGVRFAIEAKAAEEIQESDASALKHIMAQVPGLKGFIFHSGKKARKVGGLWALPLAEGLAEIGL